MRDGFTGGRAIVIPQIITKDLEQDKFISKLFITDIGHFPLATFHNRTRLEGVSQYILIYCVDGEGWYELGGKKYTVQANQCFILPPFTPHSYGSSGSNPWSIYWIHFKGELAGFYADNFRAPISTPPGTLSRIRDRLCVFEDIYTVLSNGCSRENIEFASSALYYFLGTIKYLDVYRGVNKDKNSDMNIIDSAIAYMKENVEKPISLSDICSYSGYSKSYFSTAFKAKTGHTPINYMIKLRMQVACQLLDFTDLKINQICYKVGIADQYYFSKLFSKNIGMSPSVYRSEKKG